MTAYTDASKGSYFDSRRSFSTFIFQLQNVTFSGTIPKQWYVAISTIEGE
jgi:hypothetical protein